jgi:hypothetical protein
MHVVWKRPDGFHGAEPTDYVSISVGNTKLWLHKGDPNWYPFRIAGGWQESEATKRLNNLVNRLNADDEAWVTYLVKAFEDSMVDSSERYYKDLELWLTDLQGHLKGDTWEVEIMAQTLKTVSEKVGNLRQQFLTRCQEH